MNRVPDRKKQRREYLRQKGTAYLKTTSGGIVFVFTVLLTPLLASAAIYSWVGWLLWWDRLADPGSHWDIFAIVLTVLAVISGLACYLSWSLMQHAIRSAARLSPVPPVTPNTLPAEEVLVRGSEEPQQAQSEMLVRPATAEQVTPKTQLLRVVEGEPQN